VVVNVSAISLQGSITETELQRGQCTVELFRTGVWVEPSLLAGMLCNTDLGIRMVCEPGYNQHLDCIGEEVVRFRDLLDSTRDYVRNGAPSSFYPLDA
jgi:hypothetical protein